MKQSEHLAELMRAVFKDAYRPAKDDALVDLPDPDQNGALSSMLVRAVNSTRMATGETVLVVSGEYADEQGESISSHGTGGMLSLYILRPNSHGWEVIRRHENIAELGSNGFVGQTRWVKQTNGRVLLAVSHGGVFQGYLVTYLALFDPASAQVRDLAADALTEHSDSDGTCDEFATHCWNMDAHWQFAPNANRAKYDDLLVKFSGYEEYAAEPVKQRLATKDETNGDEASPIDEERAFRREREAISGVARYVFDGKVYRLKSGHNPIKEI